MTGRDFLLLVAICVVWGLNTVVSAIVVAPHQLTAAGVPPLFYAALRFLLVSVATLPWLLPAPRPVWRMALIGCLIGAASFALLFVGLRTASAATAGVVTQLGIPFTTILSVVMLGERVRWRRGVGIALALCGVLIVMWDPHGLSISTGLLLVVGSAFAGSLGAVMMKQVDGVAPLQFQAWVGFASLPVLVLCTAGLEHGQAVQAAQGGWGLLAATAFSALVVSVVAHTAYYGLIRRYEATLIAPLTLMTPLFTIGFGVWLSHDRIDLKMVLGSALALAGVLVIALRPNHVAPLVLLLRRLA